MRRLIATIVQLAIVLAGFGIFFGSDRSPDALDRIAADVVAAIPTDVHMRIVAVADITGERGGELRDRITERLSRRSDLVVVERGKIQRILQELAFQAGALVDPQLRVKLGEMLGAEGLIYGSVERFQKGLLGGAEIAAQITLADVQRGSIAYSRRFEARSVSGLSRLVRTLAITALLLGLVELWARRAFRRRREARLAGATISREDAVSEIRQADQLLLDVQGRSSPGESVVSTRLREIRARLADFRQALETSASGRAQLQPPHRDKEIRDADADAVKAASRIRKASEEIATRSGGPSVSELDDLMNEVRAAEAAYRGRSVR